MRSKLLIVSVFILSIAASVSAQKSVPANPPAPPPPPAHDDHSAHQPKPVTELSAAEKYLTDVELINQNGEKMRFYNDVLKGKVVVINAFFTSCTNVCPPMNRSFERIQEA